jgi:drug/metabolite transporter (DMT)-like permease
MSPFMSWLLLFLANFMWAMQFTCIKLVQDDVGPYFTVWGPMTLATLMLYPLVRSVQKSPGYVDRRRKSDVLLFFVLAAIGVFPGQFFVTWGTEMSTASNAALIMLTLPISTAVLAVILLGERMTWLRWLSGACAIVGVLMCGDVHFGELSFGTSVLAGNLLIFLGVLGGAIYNTYSKKVLERYSPTELIYYTYLAMFVIMTPLVLMREPESFLRIPSFSANTWIGLLLLTVFHNYLSNVLFLKALAHLDAIQTGLCNYLITFFGVPIAVVWLGERIAPMALVGGIIILASTMIVTIGESYMASTVRSDAAPPSPLDVAAGDVKY